MDEPLPSISVDFSAASADLAYYFALGGVGLIFTTLLITISGVGWLCLREATNGGVYSNRPWSASPALKFMSAALAQSLAAALGFLLGVAARLLAG